MTEYPKQSRVREGWPAQPPRYTSSRDGQAGSERTPGYGQPGTQAGYGQPGTQAGYGQPGTLGYGQAGDGQAGDGQAGDGQAGDGQAGYQQQRDGRPGYGRGRSGLRAPRRRRRRRGWIALLSTLVVLAVLFVIGDQVAKAYAQNMIAGKLQSSSNLSTKPSVSIEGFPFLTQLAAHDIGTIDISASNVQAGRLDITSIKATATGVHLNSSFNGATIDHISGTALISFASLVNAAGAQGVTITADPAAGPNAANVSVGPLTATATVTQTGPSRITIKMESLDGIAGSLIGSLPDYTFDVPKLPAGLQIQGVSVTDQGISIKAAAQNTTLSE